MWYKPEIKAIYKTNLTMLMPTFLLMDANSYTREDAYRDPNIVSKDFPVGGMTLYLTRHILYHGGLSKHPASYGVFKIKGKFLHNYFMI